MTATTYTHFLGGKPGASFKAGLARFFWRMVEAQEKKARRRIAQHFRGLDDEHLVRLGYSPADIARVRRG